MKKLELLGLLLERYADFSVPSEIPDQVIEAFIQKIVVYPEYTDWYLRICDDVEPPIKAEISGNIRSGMKAIFNMVKMRQYSQKSHPDCPQGLS